jgi:hypothetical protein
MRRLCRRCKISLQPIFIKEFQKLYDNNYYIDCVNCTPNLIDDVEFYTTAEAGYVSLVNCFNDIDIDEFYQN